MLNDVLTHPTLLHPHTGLPLQAVGFTKRGPIWPVLGGSEPVGDDGAPPASDSQNDYKPPASQADLDRIIQQRLDRERQKFADYEAIKSKAEQFDVLAAASQTDMERAIQEAQDAAWNAAMAHAVPRVVTAQFRAEAKGVLSPEQVDALLEDMDLTKYADDEGNPDVERITAKIAALAPKQPETPRGPSSMGLGRRDSTATPGQSVSAGYELYMARKGRTAS